MTSWTVEIPGNAPTVNKSYGRRADGRVYKTAGVEPYQVGAALIVRLARPKGWMPARRVRMTYRMWFPTVRRDASNAIKALEDAIASALGCDDSLFLPCVESKEVDKVNPRIEVTIENLDD